MIMKTLTTLIGMVFLSTLSFAQKDSLKADEPDTTKIRIGKSTVIIIGDDDSEDYDFDFNSKDSSLTKNSEKKDEYDGSNLAFNIGMAGYLTPSGSVGLPQNESLLELNSGRSHSIGFSIMLDEANLIKDRWYIRAGIGLNWTKYHFEKNVAISSVSDTTQFSLDTIKSFDKNKMRVTHFQVPLLMGIRLGDLDNPFGLQFGVVGSYKLGSALIQKYTLNGAKEKDRTRDDYNFNPFKLEALARISVDNFGFYAKYSFTELFESGRAPELYPFSVGVTIGGF